MSFDLSSRLSAAKRYLKDRVYGNTSSNAHGVQLVELADARRGVVYFLGNTECVRRAPKFDLGITKSAVSDLVGDTEIVEDVGMGALALVKKVSVGREAIAKGKKILEWGEQQKQRALQEIQGYFAQFPVWLRSRYGALLDGLDFVGEVTQWLISTFAKTLADAVPGWGYVESAAQIYSGVKKGVDGACRIVQQLYAGWGVTVLGGHPAVITSALARHATVMLAMGIKDITMGSLKIAAMGAADAASGTGALISMILGILSRVYMFVDKVVQRIKMKSSLAFAKAQWAIRDSGRWIGDEHKKFSEWFQDTVVATPVVAGLVLLSGFAAHPYRFAQLLDSSGQVRTQAQFDKSVTYIERLKSLGGDLVKSWVKGYSMTFQSEDQIVKARLNAILTGRGIQHVADPLPQALGPKNT